MTAASTVDTDRDDAIPAPLATPSGQGRSRFGGRERIRPLLWLELIIIVVGERFYEYVRNLVPTNRGAAESRGWDVERLEDALGLDFGRWLNNLVARHEPVAQVMNYYYATLHFTITGGVMIWLYVARPARYRQMRTILALTTVIGLVGFYVYPLCPPRLLPGAGYLDTVVIFRTWGSWADPTIATHSNQYAAMPSLHIAWALWSGFVLYRVAHRRWVMLIGILYPAATLVVIMGTANHYLLDAVAGAAVFAVALGIEASLRSGASAVRARRAGAARIDAPRAGTGGGEGIPVAVASGSAVGESASAHP